MRFNDQKRLYRQNTLIQSDILNLPDSRGLDVTAVSGKCADIIRSIHGSMSRLAPMGDDKRRSLWFEVKDKRWVWYRLSVSTYKDRHYLYITGDTYDHHVFCDKEDRKSCHCFYEDELAGIFSKIEKYVAGLVDNILSAPEQYNSYVEKYLSYYRREGLIKRSVLNSLIPDNSYDGIDIPRVINIYENQVEPTLFSEMTLRRYMHYWRIASKLYMARCLEMISKSSGIQAKNMRQENIILILRVISEDGRAMSHLITALMWCMRELTCTLHIPMINGIFMSVPVVIGILMIASELS